MQYFEICYTISIKLCVKFKLHTSNITKVMNVTGMTGQMDLDDKTTNLNTSVLYHSKSRLTYHSSQVYNF